MPPVNKLLKIIRKQKKYLAKELAKALECSTDSLRVLENADSVLNLSPVTLCKWLKFLDFSDEEIIATTQLYARQMCHGDKSGIEKTIRDLLFFLPELPADTIVELNGLLQSITIKYIHHPARQITEASYAYNESQRTSRLHSE